MVSIVKTRPRIWRKIKDFENHADGKYSNYYYISPYNLVLIPVVVYRLLQQMKFENWAPWLGD